jgi:cytochrome P450
VMDRLTYAGAVASETMRLRPVAPVHFVAANHDLVAGDVEVPAGGALMLLTRAPSLDDGSFTRASAFLPERWLGKTAEHRAAASIPFGTGPRICPGRSLALLEMRVLLAVLYHGFEVVRDGASSDVKERYAFTMVPEGLRVRLQRRA